MSTSRERILGAVNHRQPDRVPLDFGGMSATGMHCSLIEMLRGHYGLQKRVVKAYDPFQMLGYIDADLAEAMEVDTVPVFPHATIFGNALDEWKEWRTPWGQEVLLPRTMEIDRLADGGYVVYPQGDRSALPSAKLPASGFFFDGIERQEEYDEDDPDPRDNAADFGELSDGAVARLAENARAARATGRATIFSMPGGSLSSPSGFYGMGIKRPRGMRRLADWYMAMVAFPDFVKGVFAIQTDVALRNFRKIAAAMAGDIDIVMLCTGDYGTQINTFFSPETFHDLFYPYHKKMIDWIRENTRWKVFKHCCGAIEPLLDDMIGAGFDIMNPVQCSAAGMEPETLKRRYGERVVFWGGGVDTQKTLPFGAPEEVRSQVLERCRVFSPGGGFVFSSVHNVQARTPIENVVAMLDAVKEFNRAGA